MTARRGATLTAVVFSAAVLSMSACVQEIIVGDQKEPVTRSDAGDVEPTPDAGGAEPDAEPEPGPELDAAPDAEPAHDAAASADAQPSPVDAAPDEGCPVIVYWFDGTDGGVGCDGGACAMGDAGDAGGLDPACAPEPRLLGPCSGCGGVSILVTPDECPNGGPPPVCWEDNETDCSLQCPNTLDCKTGSDCAVDEYCYFPKRDCGAAERGWCAPIPRGECLVGAAVCGCDGQRYENGCFAAQAGVHTADAPHARCP
jgi:hypothetical protein